MVAQSKKLEFYFLKMRVSKESFDLIYAEAFTRLLFALLGNLSPLIVSWIILKLFRKFTGIDMFVDDGEFAIYSLSFLAPTLYLFYIQKGKLDNIGKVLLVFVIAGLLVAAALFAGVSMKGVFPVEMGFDIEFLKIWTIVLFLFSVFASFWVQVRENKRSNPNYKQERQEQLNRLTKDFERDEGK